MNIRNLFGKSDKESADGQKVQPATAVGAVEESTDDEVTTGTKVKVIAALLVAGFAAYVAWWVQEPTTMRADLFSANAATEQTDEADPGTQQTGVKEVSIIDFAFDPAEITVDSGTTVVWINKDTVPHTVVGDNFNSGTLASGQSYSHTFVLAPDVTGEVYAYSCSLHPQMKGTVIVGLVPADSETSQTDQAQPDAMTGTTQQPQLYQAATEEPVVFGTEELFPAASGMEEEMPEPTLYMESAVDEAEVLAAVESQKDLAKSGPEDIVYAGMILGILFLNRKKLLPKTR